MPSRLAFVSKQRITPQGKRKYKDIKYPDISLSENDIYITTTVGDRLDTLAQMFYGDVDLWWIIATANVDVIRRDSFGIKTGTQIRIPSNFQGIILRFEELNSIKK